MKEIMQDLEKLVGEFLEKNPQAVISRIMVPMNKAKGTHMLEIIKGSDGACTGMMGVMLYNGGYFHASVYDGEFYRLIVDFP